MRRLGALLAALSLAGCATKPPKAECPAGQEALRTAQLFLGQQTAGVAVRPAELRRFVDEEITPRFPDGVTVLDGGGQWQGAENKLMREAAKVVLIVLPKGGDPYGRVDAVRNAYRARFKRDTLLVVTQPACVAF